VTAARMPLDYARLHSRDAKRPYALHMAFRTRPYNKAA
jgi:hypothetical protein